MDVRTLEERWGVPRLEAYRTLGSTNDRARLLAEGGCAPWTTVVADVQSRGRGRRGSTWSCEPGAGLLLSVVMPEGARAGALGLVVGLACADAVEARAPGVHVGIKWPNDLIVEGRKVGGILCEAAGDAVVVGIGINVGDAPAPYALDRETALPPAAIEVMGGKALPRNELAGEILARMRRYVADGLIGGGSVTASRYPAGEALSEGVLAEVRRRDVLAGRQVDTDQAGVGRALGIDASGALLLEVPGGEAVRIVSGSVRLA